MSEKQNLQLNYEYQNLIIGNPKLKVDSEGKTSPEFIDKINQIITDFTRFISLASNSEETMHMTETLRGIKIAISKAKPTLELNELRIKIDPVIAKAIKLNKTLPSSDD